jgi:hypothetical protein
MRGYFEKCIGLGFGETGIVDLEGVGMDGLREAYIDEFAL